MVRPRHRRDLLHPRRLRRGTHPRPARPRRDGGRRAQAALRQLRHHRPARVDARAARDADVVHPDARHARRWPTTRWRAPRSGPRCSSRQRSASRPTSRQPRRRAPPRPPHRRQPVVAVDDHRRAQRPRVDNSGCIALLEDYTESTYRIDGYLQTLLRSGWFDGVTGIALGSWAKCSPVEEIHALCLELLGPLGIPVVGEVGFGHGPGPQHPARRSRCPARRRRPALQLGPLRTLHLSPRRKAG